jgi:hypothetical protein
MVHYKSAFGEFKLLLVPNTEEFQLIDTTQEEIDGPETL